jgi:hypothetical protein
VATDAVVKAMCYANCGRAQREASPSTNEFLGTLDDQVQLDFESGELKNAAKTKAAKAAAAAAEAAEIDSTVPCGTVLTCSRPTAQARGETSRSGVVGMVCKHIFPLRSLFLAMPTPEQHGFYGILIGELFKRMPGRIRAIYLDLRWVPTADGRRVGQAGWAARGAGWPGGACGSAGGRLVGRRMG